MDGTRIGAPGAGFTAADIKYHTFGAGYIYYMTENVKWVFYYAHPINENTSLAGYTTDQKDDVFTLRLQFRF
jgi:phosphate-selective porin